MLEYNRAIESIHRFITGMVENANAKGVAVGVSGGVDSALTLKLCCDALGAERVHALLMPEHAGTADDKDAEAFARELGAVIHRYSIGQVITELREITGFSSQRTLGNMKPRLRMLLLYAVANEYTLLVAGTSNKSEIMTGYFTKYGDGASDMCPIGSLYKTQVWELARALGLPRHFIEKKPTAGLWEGQTDEGEMGISYSELDRILVAMENGKDEQETHRSTGVSVELVSHVYAMVNSSAHKRITPPVAQIDP